MILASLLISSSTCTILTLVGALDPATVTTATLVIGFGPLAASLARHASVASRLKWLSTRRALAMWLATLGTGAAALAFVVVPSHLRLGPEMIPASSTVWYYAHLAHDVAANRGFPATFPEWGTERAFQTDYAPFTAHSAAAFQFMGNGILASQEVYRLVILVAVMLFTALVFRRFVSWWIAALGAVLFVSTLRLDYKLLSYKPEMFGLAVAMATIWVADRAITERSWRLGATATAGAVLVFLAHAEVFLVLAPVIAAIGIGRGFLRVGRGAIGVTMAPRIKGALIAALILAGGLGLGAIGNGVIAGDLRLVGYITADRSAADQDIGTIPPDRMPMDWVLSGDPTWDFYVAAAAPAQMGKAPPERFTDPRLLPRSILHVWPGLDGMTREGLVLLVLLVGAPFLTWPWIDRRRRRFLLIWALFALGLLVGSYLLNEIAATYVPRRAAGRRLMPYELLMPVTAFVFWLYVIQGLLAPGWRALAGKRGAGLAAALALVVLVAGATAPAPGESDEDESPGLTAIGYEAYQWIRENLPEDARILANAYTDGAMTALSERSALLDGRAVYLEDPPFLADATALVLGARRFFQMPDDPSAEAFLSENRVGWLLVVGPSGRGADVGGYRPFDTDYAELETREGFQLRADFGDGQLLLYEVVRGGVTLGPAPPSSTAV